MADYPKISVVTSTYGQENYIMQTLNGVLMQDYFGEIEFIISNDHSPDATDEIIRNYLSSRTIPDNFIIKYTKHEFNKGMMPNFIWAIGEASGKYIALCEGDDYWTYPLKLQKQVDFLEANEDYSICYHAVEEITETGIKTNILETYTEEREFTIEDLSKGNFIHTPSVVFKNNILEFPAFFQCSPIGDYPLHMLNAHYGKIKYFPQKMAVYRVGVGVWSNLQISDRIINTMFAIKLLISYFGEIDKKIVGLLEVQYDSLYKRLMGVNNDKEKVISSFLHDMKDVEVRLTLKNLFYIAYHKLKRKIKLR